MTDIQMLKARAEGIELSNGQGADISPPQAQAELRRLGCVRGGAGKTAPVTIEIDGPAWSPGSLSVRYDGEYHRLDVRLSQAVGVIVLDEDAAQRLGRWFTWEAAAECRFQRAQAQWHPGSGGGQTP